MFKLNEIYHILLAVILLGFVMSFSLEFKIETFLIYLLFALIVIFVNILVKKLLAYYTDCDIETKIWHFQRYGLYERSYFRKPIPIGFILPLLLSVVSLGAIKFLTLLQFEVSPLKYRVAKRIGLYRFSELTETHIGAIAYSGIIANLVLAILAYLINVPELARLSVYYAAFNMLPLGKLDGNKIFFGSMITWFALAIITGLFVVYALFGI